MTARVASFPIDEEMLRHFGGHSGAALARKGRVSKRAANLWMAGINKPSVVSFLSLCQASPGLWGAVKAYVEGDPVATLAKLDKLDADAAAFRARLGGRANDQPSAAVHDRGATGAGGTGAGDA